MEPTVNSIVNAAWFQDHKTKKVMSALERARPSCARFVGGCIRNTLLGEPVSDIDIATQLRPADTLAALARANIKAIPTGIEHGTVTAIVDHEPFEITSLRRDVETDGRRAVVAFTDVWEEDAERRDFRVNALYADALGNLHDPTGGLGDIEAKRIVFIGDAEQRLKEDHLRNLRFFRFTAWYGASIDDVGLNACEAQREGLKVIAAERIWKELIKLLAASNPYGALRAMADTGVLEILLPEVNSPRRIMRLAAIEKRFDMQFDAFQRLQSLLEKDTLVASQTSKRLRLSNAESDRLTDWTKAKSVPPKNDLFAWLYHTGQQTALDQIVSEMTNSPDIDNLLNVYRIAQTWERPVFPISGADLIAAGMKPGPELGGKLRKIECDWVINGFSMDGVNVY